VAWCKLRIGSYTNYRVSLYGRLHLKMLRASATSVLPLALAIPLLSPDPTIVRATIGFVFGIAAVNITFLINRQGMDIGNVTLGALIGLMVGFPHVFVALMLAVVSGKLIANLLLMLRIKGRKEATPFGPFMAAGAFVALLCGQTIMDWYPPTL